MLIALTATAQRCRLWPWRTLVPNLPGITSMAATVARKPAKPWRRALQDAQTDQLIDGKVSCGREIIWLGSP
jgi:hypothetical protein